MMLTNPPARAMLSPNVFDITKRHRSAIALRRTVQRFFYAPHFMVAGVMGSLTARTFASIPCMSTRDIRHRHSLTSVFDGLNNLNRAIKMPRKKTTGATAPHSVQISLNATGTLLITQNKNQTAIEQLASDDVVIRKADIMAIGGIHARLNFILKKTEFLWEA